MRKARARSFGNVAVDCAVHDALVTGAAISACLISWNAPSPSSRNGACPESRTTGISPHLAVYKALIALACPGPPVTSATPTLPVMRAQASAM